MTDLAEAARDRFDLAWSSSFPAGPGRSILARFVFDDLDLRGWVLEEEHAPRPAAWLSRWDRETWVAYGVTADERWMLAPLGRHRPDFGAFDRDDRLVAACRRSHGRLARIELPGTVLRLRAPIDPFRARWRMRDGDGVLVRLHYSRSSHELRFDWERTPPMPALLSLLLAFSLIVDYANAAIGVPGGAGG